MVVKTVVVESIDALAKEIGVESPAIGCGLAGETSTPTRASVASIMTFRANLIGIVFVVPIQTRTDRSRCEPEAQGVTSQANLRVIAGLTPKIARLAQFIRPIIVVPLHANTVLVHRVKCPEFGSIAGVTLRPSSASLTGVMTSHACYRRIVIVEILRTCAPITLE